MPGINLSALKFTWRGQWVTATLYKKNDIVQFGNAAYMCLQDIPDEWMLDQNTTWSNTNMSPAELYFRDKRPDTDVQYWRIIVRGNTFKRGWLPHRTYQYGDMVRYGGDLYMYQGQPGQGAYATANINGTGNVVSITVNNGGSGYGAGTTVTIGNDGKGGNGAIAFPVITPTSKLLITAATKTNPVRITTSNPHGLTNGTQITIPDVNGMTQLIGQDFYVKTVNTTQFDIYNDAGTFSAVDGTTYSPFIASTTSGYVNVSPFISQIIVSSPGTGYVTAPTVIINAPTVRNTWPEDTTYWVKVFANPNWDTRRMYAVGTCNMQPLGWTRNNGDYPNPQTAEASAFGFIGADGVPYSHGSQGNSNSYNANGRGLHSWSNSWQPATFTFVDWLRSYDNQTALGLGGLTSGYLPTPDGLAPRCIQWVRSTYQSLFVMNNGEVYYSGYNGAGGVAGNNSTTSTTFTTRVTNQQTTGWLGETLPRSFNQTKIIKADMPNVGSNVSADVSCYALGADGSFWVWGRNNEGQLGLGQQTPGTSAITTFQQVPQRIPAVFFDNKKIVDFMCFGGQTTSVLAIDEDGDLWGWGADYYGELGLGGAYATVNYRVIPTRIPFDFKRYGGIKKMSYAHFGGSDRRFATILTNDGSLFGAGSFHVSVAPLVTSKNAANSFINLNRWTRYLSTNVNVKQIENFWIVGDAKSVNIFVRERDTGLTFAAGDNFNYTTNPDGPSNYDWFTVGGTSQWKLIKGPRNIVHVTMNEANSSAAGTSPYSFITVMMLDEQGRGWGQGRNIMGSLSVGYVGVVAEDAAQNPETGSVNNYQPIKTPSGMRIATFMGCGLPSTDMAVFITDDGQPLISGYDGAANQNLQGATQYAWINTTLAAQNATWPRYTMHSLIGD